MWFKNLVLYRFRNDVDITAEHLESSLAQQPFRACGKTELSSYGWVSPVPSGETLVHDSNGFLSFAARKEERLLPASVIKDAVNDKVSQIEADQGRQVFRKEKDQLKDEVTLDLLPRAFTRSHTTQAYIDTRNGWLVVDASSFKKAEELTSTLRACLGTLPVIPPALKHSPASIMTSWLEQQGSSLPASLTLGNECELKDLGEDGGSIRCKGQDLLTDEIRNHIHAGMQASRLAVHWNEALSCVMGDDLLIRRLKFTDELQEQSEAINAEDDASKFDADFTLMTGTLKEFLEQVIDALGGEDEDHEHIEIGTVHSQEETEEAPF